MSQPPPPEPEQEAEDEHSTDGMEVAVPNEDDDTEEYQAPPTAPPQQPQQPHRGYAAPHQQRFMVQGRSGRSGPALGASDERLKHELRSLGLTTPAGVPLYEWRYRDGLARWGLDSTKLYRGTTAQALLRAGRADAVVIAPIDGAAAMAGGSISALQALSRAGFMLVDYSRLDISLTEL